MCIRDRMDKGYYPLLKTYTTMNVANVAIHNKNGQGLLLTIIHLPSFSSYQSQSTIKMDKGYYQQEETIKESINRVAIHNKNGQGLLRLVCKVPRWALLLSQSTIKMDKGYYLIPICKYFHKGNASRNPQ